MLLISYNATRDCLSDIILLTFVFAWNCGSSSTVKSDLDNLVFTAPMPGKSNVIVWETHQDEFVSVQKVELVQVLFIDAGSVSGAHLLVPLSWLVGEHLHDISLSDRLVESLVIAIDYTGEGWCHKRLSLKKILREKLFVQQRVLSDFLINNNCSSFNHFFYVFSI